MRFSQPKIIKSLIPAKVAYFFYYFSISSVNPFIPVFITAYGLSCKQAGFILGARLFAQFLSGPCWGAIADKTRKFRFLLLLQIVISSILTFTAPWIPMVLPQTMTNNGLILTTITPLTSSSGNFSNHAANATRSTQTLPLVKNHYDSHAVNEKNFEISTNAPNLTVFYSSSTMSSSSSNNGTIQLSTYKLNGNHIQAEENNKKNNKHDEYNKPEKRNLFILMIVWFTLIGVFDGGIAILIDNAVMHTIERLEKSDFGKQRLWGAVGFGLAAFASGVGIQLSGKEKPNYNTMFYIFLGSNFCLFISCLFLDMKSPAQGDTLHAEGDKKRNLGKRLLKEFKKFHVSFFFLTMFIMGMANGLLYGFMFLYIEYLNGSNIIMGLSILVACSTEVMMFPVASKVIKLLHGNLPAITVAFGFYAIRFTGFSFLQNAWFILLLQLLHSVCFALFWAAAVHQTVTLAPEGMQATFLGIFNGLFLGIAGGMSSIFGGILYDHFGGRNLFRGIAVVCVFWTILMSLHILGKRIYRKEKHNEDYEMQDSSKDETPIDESLLQIASA